MSGWLPVLLWGVACDGDTDTYVETDGIVVQGLVLGPEPATALDTLHCRWDAVVGADAATVAWEINGAVISGLEETSLDGTWFDKGDKVVCIATPVAPVADDFRSNQVKIADAPPVVISVVITPEEANENHILHAEIEAEDPDEGDAHRIRPHYRWSVTPGGEGTPEARGVDEDALGQTYWARGDTVTVEAWVNASGEMSEIVTSAPITIGNAAPEAPTVRLVETAGAASLACQIEDEAIDLDGDAVTYSYAWRRFGLPIPGTEAELDYPDAGASYTCTATPGDGEADGTPASDSREVSGQPLRYRWLHSDAGARAGEVLVPFPDVDGDGRSELLVATAFGSLGAVEGGGAVLISSSVVGAGSDPLPGAEWVMATLTSPNQQQRYGSALGWSPDLDGDGIAEIIVGAPDGKEADRTNGLVAIVPSMAWRSGEPFSMSTKIDQDAMWWYAGNTDGARMGQSVAGLDANNDGVGDVAAGALGQHGGTNGNVTIIDGLATAESVGPLFNSAVLMELTGVGGEFGSGLAVGDYDGDGVGDLAVGAPSDASGAGAVYVFLDLPAAIPETVEDPDTAAPPVSAPNISALDADVVLSGEATGDTLGAVLATGDLDGDGLDDLLVGAEAARSGSGAAYLWVGGTGSAGWGAYVLVGADGEHLGSSVAMAGDLDGGGVGDVIIGALESEASYARAGGAHVFFGEGWGAAGGTLTSEDATWFLPGEAEGERAGMAVAGGHDFDGDGHLDLVVGSPGVDSRQIGVDVGGVNLWVDYEGL